MPRSMKFALWDTGARQAERAYGIPDELVSKMLSVSRYFTARSRR